MNSNRWWTGIVCGLIVVVGACQTHAEEPKPPATTPEAPVAPDDKQLPGLTRLAKDYDLWIDTKRKLVVLDGKICLRDGTLELFACPKGTKEHESIVQVNCPPKFVHAALLAIGAKPGSPVKVDPKYVPANGPEIEVLVLWKDKDGKPQKVRAQEWIRDLKTGKVLDTPWVFGGSRFWVDPMTGQQQYLADSGDLICVSNFPTATMDLPINSSVEDAQRLFGAHTERIPALNTAVRLVLIPKFPPVKPGEKPEEKPAEKKE